MARYIPVIAPIPSLEITSLVKFEEVVVSATNEAEKKGRFRLWRGQANSEWDLRPSVFRNGPVLEAVERIRLMQFKEQNRHLYTASVQSTWDELAVAQHFGEPTRLLDWSRSPYIGLFFALHAPTQRRNLARIWLTLFQRAPRPEPALSVNPFNPGPVAFWQPDVPALFTRIERQQGWMSCSNAHQHTGDDFAAALEPGLDAVLYSWIVPGTAKESLLSELAVQKQITYQFLLPNGGPEKR